MPPTRLLRLSALVPALFVVACSSSEEAPADTGNPELGDVVYAGQANDEGLEILLATTAVDDPTQAAVMLDPADGATVSGATPAKLTWKVGAPTASTTVPVPRQSASTFWQQLGRALDPIGTAHAHGSPMNGRAYFLTVGTTADPKLLRLFTTDLSFTPDATAWQKLQASAAPLTVTIVNAIYEEGKIVADGGPFQGVPSSFTIGD
jgi:hypothetical protein